MRAALRPAFVCLLEKTKDKLRHFISSRNDNTVHVHVLVHMCTARMLVCLT